MCDVTEELNAALENINSEERLFVNRATISASASQNTKPTALYQNPLNIRCRNALTNQFSDENFPVKLES